MLLAMATGTGKTKTCIALIYRLLKAQRFRRVLFLVDRSALGEQAANAFKDTRMESLQTFADIFGIKELDEQKPDTDTAVHIATVQGMVQRVLYPAKTTAPPPVDQYDCIVVDECHRGYLLDRELSDTELEFRELRRLHLEVPPRAGLLRRGEDRPHRHAGAAHHADLRRAVFTYSYREAVIDGYLVDHEPPVQINTELSSDGIAWRVGRSRWRSTTRGRNQIDLFTTPDEIKLDVEDFNRKVITESFNRVVCEDLAQELDPSSRQKTLIFCANDAHADLVVDLLKQAFDAAVRQRRRRRRHQDHRRRRQAAAADPPLQERAQPERRRHGGPAHHRRRRARDLQPRVPAPGEQPHPVRPDARPRDAPVRRDRQGGLPHLRRRGDLRGAAGPDGDAAGGGRTRPSASPSSRASWRR